LCKEFPIHSKALLPSVELSPVDLNKDYILRLKEMGMQRISIGIQSFVKREFESLSRVYLEPEFVKDIIDFLRNNNIGSNIDLIYGLPQQTGASFAYSLNKVMEIAPDHVSIYPLAVIGQVCTGTYKGTMELNDHIKLADMKKKYELYDKAYEVLTANGYNCENVTNYVKKDRKSFMQAQQFYQSQDIPILGIGAGAISYAADLHYCILHSSNKTNKEKIDEYLSKDFSDLKYQGFHFTKNESMRRYIILFLLGSGVSKNNFEKMFSEKITKLFDKEITELLSNGLIEVKDDLIKLTSKGIKYSHLAVSIFVSKHVQELCNVAY
jgi:oxygen-independent coproporphyrinogen III oxidase